MKYNTPLIDREIFFGNPEIQGGQISPNGKYLSFIKPYNGVMNIWIKEWDEDINDSRPLTQNKSQPIYQYFWTRDSKYLIYVEDQAGNENYHLFRVDYQEILHQGYHEKLVVNLTPYDGVRAFIYSLPKSNHNEIIVGLNERDAAWHDVYRVDVTTGSRHLILENTMRFTGVTFDLKDNIKIIGRTNEDGGHELLRYSNNVWTSFYQCDSEENLSAIKFHEDGRLYIISNKGDIDLSQLQLLDVESGKVEFLEDDPEQRVDIENVIFSDMDDRLLATRYISDKKKIYWKDEGFENDYELLKEKFEDAEISLISGTEDEKLWLITVHKDTDPGSTYTFDRNTKEVTFMYTPRPDMPIDALCPMDSVRYVSTDGVEISAYLTMPSTTERENLPAIIMVHGGPWARDYWGFSGFVQFFANRGYVVMMPNFRGSSGFGKNFLNLGNKEWGMKIQDDVNNAAQYLIDRGIANAGRIAIFGGSFGGYATLAGLTFTPDVYAAGISVVGPSNLFTLLNTIPPYWASALKMFHLRMGDPSTEEGHNLLRKQSPYFHARHIKAPLMIVQGNNDPRVKTTESEQMVVACREADQDVIYLNFPDEGHGFSKPQNTIAFLSRAEQFLAQHIGGRYQQDIPSNINDILQKVTVDTSEVEVRF